MFSDGLNAPQVKITASIDHVSVFPKAQLAVKDSVYHFETIALANVSSIHDKIFR